MSAERLDHADVSADMIRQAYDDALEDQPVLGEAFRADIVATVDRDPATQPLHRAGALLQGLPRDPDASSRALARGQGPQGFRALPAEPCVIGVSDATSIRRRKSAAASSSITPPAWWSARPQSIEDDVSILHDVTLGGTGKEHEDRHPKIRRGVMIGAGAKILGNIEVGHCARIAAGSVVIKPVPNNVTVAGVPAKVVGEAGCPSRRAPWIRCSTGSCSTADRV